MVAMKMRAFSLVELLVVVAIIGLLAVLAVPAMSSITGGTSMTRAGQIVADQFAYARQEAVGKNREVQVRFVWRDGSQPGYAGVQLWAPAPNDVTSYRPISRISWLPDGTVMASNSKMSPLIAGASIRETNGVFPGRGNTKYCGFRFRPGGGTDLGFDTTSNFVTVVRDRDAAKTDVPDNYAVIQVDQVNGRIRTYRP
ncbi:Verru_Chthon cassette protein D [Terrimicrobium sacchariphilum]|uniref:Verru_Chthon cassette protein D n=2 Tax=Terrimicrobium sacchariphilum TaxID=690879 RepID=A0A146GGA7_TERSA|nr:Verru_Chthon cassette protein D [Terrimicrobium sacchariphilum]